MRRSLLLAALLCAGPGAPGAEAPAAGAVEGDGSTLLMQHVIRDDLAGAQARLRAGDAVNAASVNGVTALHLACVNGNVPMMGLLLDAGADIAGRDGAGETPLMSAVRGGSVVAVRLLIERGAEVDAREPHFGQTALMIAGRGADPALVAVLIEAGADVNARTRVGPAPRFRLPAENTGSKGKGISRGGWPEWGARAARPGGMTPLLYASREGNLETVRMLHKAGASLELADANDIRPLVMALTNGQLDVAQELIEAGADVNAADWFGRGPLWSAIDIRNCEVNDGARDNGVDREAALAIIDALLERGARPDARIEQVTPVRFHILTLGAFTWVDVTGETPFIRAALAGDVTVMKRLLARGADPHLATYKGTNALMAAAGMNWVVSQTWDEGPAQLLEAVKLAVELGLDVNARNSMGMQAIHAAANRGSDDIMRFLAANGAELDRPDNEGRTPLDWAHGVFLATVPPAPKPSSIELLQALVSQRAQENRGSVAAAGTSRTPPPAPQR